MILCGIRQEGKALRVRAFGTTGVGPQPVDIG